MCSSASEVGQVRAVLFDLDDTLISRQDAFDRHARSFYNSQPGIHGTPLEEAVALLAKWDGGGENDKEVYFGRIKERWPGVSEPTSQLIEEFWDGLSAAVAPDENALEFLGELDRAGIPWGIITNGPRHQFHKMRQARLIGMPRFTIVSQLYGCSKPDPRIFREGLRRLDCRAEETLFVGDNPMTDIRGAQGVGLRTAWVRGGRDWTWGEPAPQFEIDHVTDLRSVLLG